MSRCERRTLLIGRLCDVGVDLGPQSFQGSYSTAIIGAHAIIISVADPLPVSCYAVQQ